jgi:Flp pilus assembly protein protease CpaA
MRFTTSDLVGVAGAATVLVAYLLNQLQVLGSGDWKFPLVNLVGSLLITYSLLFNFNLPSMLIEIFWSMISIYGVCRSIGAARGRAAP